MSVSLLGRVITSVGLVLGLLGISLAALSASGVSAGWADDGTVFAFLLVTLSVTSLASSIEDNPGVERAAAAMGTAAFGFFLFVPATFAFNRLGYLGSGAWLGICAGLIPLGALITWSAERTHAATGSSTPASAGPGSLARGPAPLLALAGLVLIVVGIWLPAGSEQGSPSFWNLSSSGHALGILTLLLVLLSAGLLARVAISPLPIARDGALLAVATTFGLVEAALIQAAFEDFGTLGSGAWVQAVGGLLLLIGGGGLVAARREHEPSAVAAGATPA